MFSKQLSDSCWILTSALGHHVALVWQRDDLFISSHKSDRTYNSLHEIASEFSEYLTEKSADKEEVINKVLDYPIKHDKAFDISESPYPTYKSKENSNITFAAGYWVMHVNGGYRVSLSPKVSTLDELCQGPFMDKFSANVSLTSTNKRKATNEIISEYKDENDQTM